MSGKLAERSQTPEIIRPTCGSSARANPTAVLMEATKESIAAIRTRRAPRPSQSRDGDMACETFSVQEHVQCVKFISPTDNHCGLSLKHLSESERFRFSVAFQIVLATATGIRFIVIDRADILDNERRKLLTVLLSNSDVEQAITLAGSEKALPSIVPEGLKFLELGALWASSSTRHSKSSFKGGRAGTAPSARNC